MMLVRIAATAATAVFLSAPAVADVETDYALLQQRVTDEPALAKGLERLIEISRGQVRGYGNSAFHQSLRETLHAYGLDGTITEGELRLAEAEAVKRSYDQSIKSLIGRLTQGMRVDERLPLSLTLLVGARAGEIKSRELARVLDLDASGDWQVSRAEIEARAEHDEHFRPEGVIRYDFDKDGSITIDEITAGIDADPAFDTIANGAQLRGLSLLDLDRDNLIELGELTRVIDALEHAAMLGRDTASAEGLRAMLAQGMLNRGPWRGLNPPRDSPDCGRFLPLPEQEVILLSTYEGGGATNIAVDGQATHTTVASIEIEAGETPLFILAASQTAVIWRFTGAVERVAKLVVQEGQGNGLSGGAGVTGIPAEDLQFLRPGACVDPFSTFDDLEVSFGLLGPFHEWQRTPSRMIADYALTSAFVPSGKIKTERGLGDGDFDLVVHGTLFERTGAEYRKSTRPEAEVTALNSLWRRFLDKKAGGLFAFAPDDVVASGSAEIYDVMPGDAGLIQLIKDGRLQVQAVRQGQLDLVLTRQIDAFPLGLRLDSKTLIILGKGVKRPAGDLLGARVFSLDTGECLTAIRCD